MLGLCKVMVWQVMWGISRTTNYEKANREMKKIRSLLNLLYTCEGHKVTFCTKT